MKFRRHHNNKGTRQIKRGKTYEQVKAMVRRLRKRPPVAVRLICLSRKYYLTSGW